MYPLIQLGHVVESRIQVAYPWAPSPLARVPDEPIRPRAERLDGYFFKTFWYSVPNSSIAFDDRAMHGCQSTVRSDSPIAETPMDVTLTGSCRPRRRIELPPLPLVLLCPSGNWCSWRRHQEKRRHRTSKNSLRRPANRQRKQEQATATGTANSKPNRRAPVRGFWFGNTGSQASRRCVARGDLNRNVAWTPR